MTQSVQRLLKLFQCGRPMKLSFGIDILFLWKEELVRSEGISQTECRFFIPAHLDSVSRVVGQSSCWFCYVNFCSWSCVPRVCSFLTKTYLCLMFEPCWIACPCLAFFPCSCIIVCTVLRYFLNYLLTLVKYRLLLLAWTSLPWIIWHCHLLLVKLFFFLPESGVSTACLFFLCLLIFWFNVGTLLSVLHWCSYSENDKVCCALLCVTALTKASFKTLWHSAYVSDSCLY